MIGNVPDGWRVENLKDITEFLTCGVAKRPEYVDKDVGIPFLSSKNAKTNRMILNDYNCVSKEDYEILTKYYKPQRGDVLYTRVGSFGEAVVVNVDFDFAVFVSLTIMRVKPEIVNNYYLSNILNSPSMKQIANEKARGIGVKNLNVGDVRKFLIPIPPLPQQEKIVKVLDISSALIEKQKELIANYDLFLKSKFIEMFGDPVKNPMGWEVVKLGRYGILARGKSAHRPRNAPFLYGGKYPFIQTGDLTKGNSAYLKKFKQTYSEDGIKQSKLFPKNTIAITIAANIGDTKILSFDCYFPDSVVGFNVDIPLFVSSLFSYYKGKLEQQATKTAQKNINLKVLNNLDVLYPPIELQNKFASIVEKIETIKTKEIQKLEHLETLHKSLMDKAFKGEIK